MCYSILHTIREGEISQIEQIESVV